MRPVAACSGVETSTVSPPVSSSVLAPVFREGDRWLVWDLGVVHRTLSWAVVGGGISHHQKIVWRQIQDHELRPPVDAETFLHNEMQAHGHQGAAAFMTSADLSFYGYQHCSFGEGHQATVVATVGLGNALRIGDPPGPTGRIGTINIACVVTRPLCLNAELEVLSLVAEARTAAMLDAAYPSVRSGYPATGTGTDCILVASPMVHGDQRGDIYGGKHTSLGHVVGLATYRAVAESLKKWMAHRS